MDTIAQFNRYFRQGIGYSIGWLICAIDWRLADWVYECIEIIQKRGYYSEERVYSRGGWVLIRNSDGKECVGDIYIEITHHRRSGTKDYQETIDSCFEMTKKAISEEISIV